MRSSVTENKIKYRLVNPELPLAVYREVAAHLRQVEKVEAGLIIRPLSSESEQFDYAKSQIEALWLEYPQNLSDRHQKQIEQILDYYAQRYRPWQQAT
ncbi:hypothetical protein [Myxosarcina sp. GI1(2024)]